MSISKAGNAHSGDAGKALEKVELSDGVVILRADFREALAQIGKVDAVITDLPYGTTQCSWDIVIPFTELWGAIGAVTSKNTPIVLFGSEPFSSLLRVSNLRQFKYDWIWDKPKGTGFLNAKKQPLRGHETISVFCDGTPPYYPQKTKGHVRKQTFRGKHLQTDVYGNMAGDYFYDSTERYPRSVITFSSDTQNSSVHPTQKPVALCEYLVATYTQPGDAVLDLTMGSGTTGIACVLQGRRFFGIELAAEYFATARSRITAAISQQNLFSRLGASNA